jgi:hypothetical protein
MDRLEGEFGPAHLARQRTQARRPHRERQHRAAAVGDMDVIAPRALYRRHHRKTASVERVPGIADGDGDSRLGHLRFPIAPQGSEVWALSTTWAVLAWFPWEIRDLAGFGSRS